MAIRAAANNTMLVLILSPVTDVRVFICCFIFLPFAFDFYFFVVVDLWLLMKWQRIAQPRMQARRNSDALEKSRRAREPCEQGAGAS